MVRLAYLVENTGQLLHEGGLGDQPAWLIEAIEIISAVSANRIRETRHGKPKD